MIKNFIRIKGARENNLKNVSLQIPKHQITVFTGVSGSGKSSIVFDTIATEAQRQLTETYTAFLRGFMPRYSKPEADAIENLSVAIVIDQKRMGGNSRSTLGTITDISASLRILFSRWGQPYIGQASAFSFNDPEGMCTDCDGIGRKMVANVNLMFDKTKSLNEGAILLPNFKVGSIDWKIFTSAGFFDLDKKLQDYTEQEWKIFLHGNQSKVVLQYKGIDLNVSFEGIVEKFTRLYIKRDMSGHAESTRNKVEKFMIQGICPTCEGKRLNEKTLSCRVQGFNIAEMSAMEVGHLKPIIDSIDEPSVLPVVHALSTQLDHLISIGLDYISLNRETATLSGGESQRVKMVKQLGCNLTDILYVFDEPSIGLHPRDVHRLNQLLQKLRDKGNTVIVVEHDPDVIQIADHIVDVGPHAGINGGEIVFEGNYQNLLASNTLTGKYLKHHAALKPVFRKPKGYLPIKNISENNLKNVSVNIPSHVLTVVTGVAGSGKSTLINGAFLVAYPQAIAINQAPVSGSVRSNPATYTGMMDEIRTLFATANKVNAALFSFNSKGACPHCQGLGYTEADLAFMEGVRYTCEVCEGKRFKPEVLGHTFQGKSINDVLSMSFREAAVFFTSPTLLKILHSLCDVGVGYLTLGQPLSTLSGGECQRVKLARELHKKGSIYVMDEPTTGLHTSDIDNLMVILNRLVDNGNSVIVIEHNLEIIKRADWLIDLGPEGGKKGGNIIFEGTPQDILNAENSLTGQYLKRSLL
ncbi:MAG: excinuclease ABC subunit UvrA [Bacteroidia bacterium]|nr:excinuclease ABC subunit UvrA [Bacteroidia bacterium]